MAVLSSERCLVQVTEALTSGDLRPPHVPFELLQQLVQSRAVLADLRATLTNASILDDSSVPGSQVYWTARLSAVAARHEGAAASSSTGAEQLPGPHAAVMSLHAPFAEMLTCVFRDLHVPMSAALCTSLFNASCTVLCKQLQMAKTAVRGCCCCPTSSREAVQRLLYRPCSAQP